MTAPASETLEEKRARIAARVQSHDTPMEKTPEQLEEERRQREAEEKNGRERARLDKEKKDKKERAEEGISGVFNDAASGRRSLRTLPLAGALPRLWDKSEGKPLPAAKLEGLP